ncbi:ABC transporter permease DevC [Leptolyngbya sp. AN03gr2]|uniref:ABC transporter permease DevC n=1 Tax=unclassified Leptolyngbya TaxID=2650499 RepID=UPI003D30F9D9
MQKRNIPVAWKQLMKQKGRMLVAIAGITFADMLMFMQLGIRDALFNGAVQLHSGLKADLVLTSKNYQTIVSPTTFAERRLYQVEGFSGVQSVVPVYADFGKWKNPSDRTSWSILVLGFNPRTQAVTLPGVAENQQKLELPDTVLFDQGARTEFGNIADLIKQGNPVVTEVENRQIRVEGLFKLGTSFGINGTLITSDINFLRMMNSKRKPGAISLGLVQLEAGVNRDEMLQKLRNELPNDVKILTKADFIEAERQYWANGTAIGYTFTLGAVIGFVVGAVIVYQILYSDVRDHLPEYAILKAIGFRDRFLLSIVFQEALILALLGFLPGIGIASFVYGNMQRNTLLPIYMTPERATLVFVLTCGMCTVSAAIAVRKLSSADPAEVY